LTELSIALQSDKSIFEYSKLAKLIEGYQFDRISVYNDLLYQPAWPALFEIARVTNTIKLGPAAVNPFTSHPINIAGNIALLDELSGGRAYLGMARGSWLDFLGIEPEKPLTALQEAFAAIEHLLFQRNDPKAGQVFPLAGGDSLRWDIQRPAIPKLLGSWGLKTLGRCYPFIDEVKLGGSANPDMARWYLRQADRIRSQLETDKIINLVMGAVSVVDQDSDTASLLARQELALYFPVVARLDPTVRLNKTLQEEIQEAANKFDYDTIAEAIPSNLMTKFAFVGTPEEIVEQCQDLINAGVSCIEFGTPHGIQSREGLALLGEQVLPELKSFMKTR